MVNRIYPPELQLNKANTSDTEAPFLDLHLSISNGFVSSKIYDKRDDFDFDIVYFPFLDGDVPRSTSYRVYIEGMVNRIYPPELQLNKANTADTEAPFLDLHLSISNGFVSSKIYNKRDDFDFDIVNFPFLDGDVPRSTSYGVYISQLIRFARVSSHVVDFNARNKSLTAKLLQQGYRYHKLRKTFSKFYRRHYELVSKFNVGLKTLLHQGLSEPEFYGDLVYKFKKIQGRVDFSDQFRKIIVRYKRIGYNINIMRQSACLVFNPITVNNFASLFNCTPVGRASDSMMAPT